MSTDILDPIANELKRLATQAEPAVQAAPGIASMVLRRARRARLRMRIAMGTTGVLVAGALAAGSLVGHSRYYDYVQPSEAMAPTIAVGDIVTIDKSLAPQVGDVVLVKIHVDGQAFTALYRYAGDATHAISRTSIGAQRAGNSGLFTFSATAGGESITTASDHVFLLGDNRLNARDSRYFGAVPSQDILGVALRVRTPGQDAHNITGTPAHAGTGTDTVDPPAEVPTASSISR